MNFGDFFREFALQSAIQTGIQSVLGLIAVASQNPKSSTFLRFKPALRTLRDGLLTLPLDDVTSTFGTVKASDFAEAPRRRSTD